MFFLITWPSHLFFNFLNSASRGTVPSNYYKIFFFFGSMVEVTVCFFGCHVKLIEPHFHCHLHNSMLKLRNVASCLVSTTFPTDRTIFDP